ncbi:hypothetical protein P691DRAFT_758270 [Macrolepiota fuliginosa MF-IS2]|uniref:DUF6534 domain-containing protein n=1 Tax=Macrolepiota fuliginosa MF-IS2 TaxID=1400762 RepID=A0A9P6C3Q1_9AGAR|nr:hypothetical protein P691DRAFT_758270 [Macrolepiota fuliginosa MF-IS2]
MSMEAFHISNTFGVMLIGALITMSIYGITTLQVYFYYMSYPKDEWWMKWLVGAIWTLDTIHVILMCHCIHYYLIRGFGNPALLSDGLWSLYASMAANVLIAFIVQCYFSIRIHKLSPVNHRWWISSGIVFTVVAHLCFGMETVAYLFIKKQFVHLKDITLVSAMPFGVAAVLSDIVIALALCILLHSNRSEFEETNHIINKLIVYAINRCILTTAVAIVEVVVFSVTPNPFYTFAIDFAIGKLYANSFIAALNSRAAIRDSLVAYHSTEISTNFVATGIATEHDHSDMQVRSRDSARDNRFRGVDLEIDVESKQTRTSSTVRKGGQSWS